MMSLSEVELHFQNHLQKNTLDILPHVFGTNKVPAEVRLSIYQNAYRWRLHEVLVDSYPVTEYCLNEVLFETLCYDYIAAHPSHFPSIRWFGDKLPAFLKGHPSTQDKPYLAELALFEWTLALCFDAKDMQVLTLEDMHHIPPESWATLRFILHPSVHLLTFSWNVVSIWQEHKDTKTRIPPLRLDKPIHWILWRETYETLFSSMMPDEAWAIEGVQKGMTFGDLCEGLCQWMAEDQAALRAASLLKTWITSGIICGLDS